VPIARILLGDLGTGEKPRWGTSPTPPATGAMCRGRLRPDRVVRVPPALRKSPNAPWEKSRLAQRLHEAASVHRHAVQRSEKTICSSSTRTLGSVPSRTCPTTAGRLAECTAVLNSRASAPTFSS